MTPSFFFAKVVNVKDDKEMIGRALIRAISDQDDKGRIPDEGLRWARPIMNTHDTPQFGGVGRGGTSLLPGTTVLCMYMDNDRQHPFIIGAVGTAGKTNADGTIVREGKLEDGTEISAGTPFAGKGFLDFHRNIDMLDGNGRDRVEGNGNVVRQILKNITLQEFFDGDSGNGPPRYGKEINHLGSIFFNGYVADMSSYIKGFNPNNIGGIPATLNSLINLASTVRGLPQQILGEVAGSLMKTVSSIINIGANNFLNALGNIATNLTDAMGVTDVTIDALGGIARAPLSPLQRIGYNVASGAIISGDIGSLTNISNGVSEIQNSESGNYNNAAYSNIASSITKVSGSNANAIQTMAQASNIANQIREISFNAGIYEGVYSTDVSEEQEAAIVQVISLARQAGQVLGAGDTLVQYTDRPAVLISQINFLMQNIR